MTSDLSSITPDYIKQKLKISEVLRFFSGESSNLSNGSWWCPIHERGGKRNGHKTPSLVALDDRGIATCMSKQCFDSDDIFGIISKITGESDFQKLKMIACGIGGIRSTENLKPINKSIIKSKNLENTNHFNFPEISQKHQEYLTNLGLSSYLINLLELKSFEDFILYPQFDTKCSLIGYKGISIDKNSDNKSSMRFWDKKGSLWPYKLLKKKSHLLLCEGEKDAMTLLQKVIDLNLLEEYSVCTFTTGALSISEDFIDIINKFEFYKISVFYDNDEAGKKGSQKIFEILTRHNNIECNVYRFSPEKEKGYDIFDFFSEGYGFLDLFKLDLENYNILDEINTNSKSKIDLSSKFSYENFLNEVSLHSKSLYTGFSIEGIPILLPKGNITVIAGPTGHGKTLMQCSIALQVLLHQDDSNVLFLSLEEQESEILIKLLNNFANLTLHENNQAYIKSLLLRESESDSKISKNDFDFLKKKNVFFSSFISSNRLKVKYVDACLDDLINELYTYIESFKTDLIILDYIQLIYHKQRSVTMSRQEEVKLICKKLKNFCMDTSIPILLGSQFNRQVLSKDDLLVTNLSESGDIERIASQVLGLWNTFEIEEKAKLFIKVLKSRTGRSGISQYLAINPNLSQISLESDKTFDKRNFDDKLSF